MKRGPKPTPRAILKLRGSARANKNPNQPVAPAARPTMPTWLHAEAKRVWREWVPQLAKLGIIAKLDRHALAMLCQAWAQYRECEQHVAKHGMTTELLAPNGTVTGTRISAQARELDRLRSYLLKIMAEFGLTPSSRTQIGNAPGTEEMDKLDAFLNRKVS